MDKKKCPPIELDAAMITVPSSLAYCLTRLNPIPREAPRTSITLFLRNSLNLTFSCAMSTPPFLILAILCGDPITPLSVTMLSGRSARRQAKGRKTNSVKNKDAEDTAMVASEMKRFWMVYDTEGIRRGEIELKLKPGFLTS